MQLLQAKARKYNKNCHKLAAVICRHFLTTQWLHRKGASPFLPWSIRFNFLGYRLPPGKKFDTIEPGFLLGSHCHKVQKRRSGL